jgi:hypothetical protein
MPINRMFEGHAFGPAHCQAMGTAFDGVIRELRLKDRDDPLCQMVAKTIIQLVLLSQKVAADA